MKKNYKKKKRVKSGGYIDYSLLAIMAFLICFGLVMLYSCSSYDGMITYHDSMHYFKGQLGKTILGLGAMWFVSKFDYHIYKRLALLIYTFAFFLMFLVRFSPLGYGAKGAKRWLNLGFISFQPSELMKIAVIIFLSCLICKMGKNIQTWQGCMVILGFGVISALGVYKLTDNLSTGVIVLGIACAILFVVYRKSMIFAGIGIGLVTVVTTIAWNIGLRMSDSENFRLRRLIAWVNPEKYAGDFSFQTVQGLYAIGSGGFFGKGLGNGAQKMIIPEVQNDMILSAICEELGVFGALVILLLFGMLLYRLMFIAQNAPDKFGSLLVTGIFAHIAIQVILNVGVVTNLIPNTGITLPFISSGGTSLLFLFAEMGIVLGVSSKIRLQE